MIIHFVLPSEKSKLQLLAAGKGLSSCQGWLCLAPAQACTRVDSGCRQVCTQKHSSTRVSSGTRSYRGTRHRALAPAALPFSLLPLAGALCLFCCL